MYSSSNLIKSMYSSSILIKSMYSSLYSSNHPVALLDNHLLLAAPIRPSSRHSYPYILHYVHASTQPFFLTEHMGLFRGLFRLTCWPRAQAGPPLQGYPQAGASQVNIYTATAPQAVPPSGYPYPLPVQAPPYYYPPPPPYPAAYPQMGPPQPPVGMHPQPACTSQSDDLNAEDEADKHFERKGLFLEHNSFKFSG